MEYNGFYCTPLSFVIKFDPCWDDTRIGMIYSFVSV